MKSLELRWGLIIGAANLVWLYGSYYLGLHTSGLGAMQAMVVVSLAISIVGYVLAMRALMRQAPETSIPEGIRSAAIIAGVAAAIAVLAQVGYFKMINPGWTEFMVEQTREHFANAGLEEEQLAQVVEQSRKTFGLGSYATQAAMGALVIGMLTSTISLFVMRRRQSV